MNDAAPGPIRKPSFPGQVETYIQAGLQLIPLHKWDAVDSKGRPRGKTPRDGAWGVKDYDSTEVAAAAIKDGRNIGVRLPDSVMVLDVDPRNFGDGDSLLSLQIETGMDLRGVPQTATGSGGAHYWFNKPIDVQLLDTLAAFPGVEFKSIGRQVVAAGSIHPNGVTYAWVDGVMPDLRNLPDIPGTLLQLIKRPVRSHGEAAGFGELTCEMLAETIEQLDPCDFQDHDDWLTLMMACHHATAGEARQEFIDWSTQDGQYADDGWIIGRRWDSLHADSGRGGKPVTVRYLHKVLQATGGEVARADAADDFEEVEQIETERGLTFRHMFAGANKKPETTFLNCLTLLRQLDGELGLAFDEFGQTPQLIAAKLPWSADVGRRINDDVVRRIRQYLVELTGMNWGKDDVMEAVLTLVRENQFHPVRDYLNNLTWDGVPRLDTFLVKYAGVADSPYSRAIGAKALLAAVRRVRHPGCKFDNVVILESNMQGTGKSSFVKVLTPNEEWFSDAPIGNTESKDAPLSLQGKWIIELGEMSVLSKSGVESLKAFISCGVDLVRRPYARMHEELRRQCIFIGTTNQDTYLKDQTGNRRFWPVKVGEIDLDSLEADRDQLWAEAAVREAAGESLLLAQELWGAAAEEQEDRALSDPWIDILRSWLDGPDANGPDADGPGEPLDRVHVSELLTVALGIRASDQTHAHASRLSSS